MLTATGRNRARVASANSPGEWAKDAACTGLTDMFHSDYNGDQEAALAICQTCRVRDACLDFAMRTRQPQGVWGGTTPDDRKKLRKQVKR
jgi:hypothetical protein